MLGFREIDRMLRLTIADDDQLGAAAADLRKYVTQLRHLLSAEDPTKVADEGEDHRLVTPQIARPNSVPARIQHVDVFETFRHVNWCGSLHSAAGPRSSAPVRPRLSSGHPPPSRERPGCRRPRSAHPHRQATSPYPPATPSGLL